MINNSTKHKFIFLKLLAVGTFAGCFPATEDIKQPQTETHSEWQYLIDSDLSKFERYLGFAHSNGYDGSPPVDSDGRRIEPIGLNPEGYDVFTVQMENDLPILNISGEYYGSVTTLETFRNYHLKLQFKWGEKIFEPRLDKLKDSGVLYHAQGPHGAEHWRSWKLSQEFQIMEGHIGDYWSQATSAIDIRAYPREYIMSPIADARRDFISVGAQQAEKGFVMRSKNMEIENDWNTIELITFEGKSLHIVNGEVVMVLANSRYYDGNIEKPLIEGQIQIQSEAAELFVKNMAIREIDAIPPQYSRLFDGL